MLKAALLGLRAFAFFGSIKNTHALIGNVVQGLSQGARELELVVNRALDVDALDGVGVLAHAIQRNNDVFVNFKSVGVPGNGGRARTIGPEGFSRFGRDRHKALARALIGKPNDFRGRAGDCLVGFADDIANKHHLGKGAALAFGAVAHRTQVPLIEVLKACEHGPFGLLIKIGFDIDNGGHGLLGIAKIFKAYRTNAGGHAVKNPDCAGN